MKKIDSFTQSCYDYMDALRPYCNDANMFGPSLEDKFGLECYVARQIVGDWIKYTDARITHPWEKERFQRWWSPKSLPAATDVSH